MRILQSALRALDGGFLKTLPQDLQADVSGLPLNVRKTLHTNITQRLADVCHDLVDVPLQFSLFVT